MSSTFLQHVPPWVFALLLALIALGLSQVRARRVGWRRSAVLPAALLLLSLVGVRSSFGSNPLALLGWAGGLLATLALLRGRLQMAGTRYCAETRSFEMPGSWLPLVLMLSLFMLKFAVGASLAMQPALREATGFALGVSLAYGGFSGVFLGRALALWRLMQRSRPASVLA